MVRQDAVWRIGKPDRPIRFHYHVIRRVQALTFEAVDQRGHRTIEFAPQNRPRTVGTVNNPTLPVVGVTVREIARRHPLTDATVAPPKDAIVRNVTPNDRAIVLIEGTL